MGTRKKQKADVKLQTYGIVRFIDERGPSDEIPTGGNPGDGKRRIRINAENIQAIAVGRRLKLSINERVNGMRDNHSLEERLFRNIHRWHANVGKHIDETVKMA